MGFNMDNFMKNVDSRVDSAKRKYAKAYKLVEITSRGQTNEKEVQRNNDLTHEMDDLTY